MLVILTPSTSTSRVVYSSLSNSANCSQLGVCQVVSACEDTIFSEWLCNYHIIFIYATRQCTQSVFQAKKIIKKGKEVKRALLLFLFPWNLCLLTVPFVWYGELLATFGAARSQYTTSISSCHSLTETVLVVAATVVGLKCPFHIFLLFGCLVVLSFSRLGQLVMAAGKVPKRPNN